MGSLGKVALEGEMKEIYGGGRVMANERAGQVHNGMVEPTIEGKSEIAGGRHFDSRGCVMKCGKGLQD